MAGPYGRGLEYLILSLQRIFHPRRRRFDEAAQLGLQGLHGCFHVPGDLAVAEMAFHAAAQAGDVFGFGEIHLEEEARSRAEGEQVMGRSEERRVGKEWR